MLPDIFMIMKYITYIMVCNVICIMIYFFMKYLIIYIRRYIIPPLLVSNISIRIIIYLIILGISWHVLIISSLLLLIIELYISYNNKNIGKMKIHLGRIELDYIYNGKVYTLLLPCDSDISEWEYSVCTDTNGNICNNTSIVERCAGPYRNFFNIPIPHHMYRGYEKISFIYTTNKGVTYDVYNEGKYIEKLE